MILLVAELVDGRYVKVGRIRLTVDGTRVVSRSKALKPGTAFYKWALSAGKWIAGETVKPESLDFEHGTIRARVSLIG